MEQYARAFLFNKYFFYIDLLSFLVVDERNMGELQCHNCTFCMIKAQNAPP